MINKINQNPISEILRGPASKKADACGESDKCTADASLQTSYDTVIEKAQQAPAEDVNAVERARQLILSGELDSPENIRKAAENIAKFGV